MATPLDKSVSSNPLPSKPTNPRNTEVCNPIRRSFIGNPFDKQFAISKQKATAVNNTTDITQINSGSRESKVAVRNSEEENYEDHNVKQVVVRSPVSSKGCKNFMCPTISATSKVNGPLRRRVLREKNESIRFCANDSLSSEGKVQCLRDEKIPKFKKDRRMVTFDSTVTYFEDLEARTKNDDDFRYLEEKDHANLDLGLMIARPRTSLSFYSSNLDLAPLDADPLMRMYSLQTDDLSHGPKVLNYNPNPRIVQYTNKERNKNQPDESISLESSSSDPDEETNVHDNSLEEYEKTVSVNSKIELTTDVSLDDDKFRGEAKKVCKTNFVTRRKLAILFSVIVIACLWVSVTNSPFMDPSLFNKSLSFSDLYVPPQISHYFKIKLQGSVATQFRQLQSDTYFHVRNDIISFIENSEIPPQLAICNTFFNNVMRDLIFFREGENMPQQVTNTTTLPIDDANGPNRFAFVHGNMIVAEMECKTNDDDLEPTREIQSDAHSNYLPVKEKPRSMEIDAVAAGVAGTGEVAEAASQVEDDAHVESCEKPAFFGDDTGEHDEKETVSEHKEAIYSDSERIQAEKQRVGCCHAELLPNAYSAEFGSSDDDSVKLSLIRIKTMVGIAVLVLALLASLSFICAKQNLSTATAASAAIITMDLGLKSCPSELSSSYCKQRWKASNEIFSHNMKPKKTSTSIRESLAYSDISTMGSPSYGSFTTYEKLPSRHVIREEELMFTPVRRSSRIRNNVTSL